MDGKETGANGYNATSEDSVGGSHPLAARRVGHPRIKVDDNLRSERVGHPPAVAHREVAEVEWIRQSSRPILRNGRR